MVEIQETKRVRKAGEISFDRNCSSINDFKQQRTLPREDKGFYLNSLAPSVQLVIVLGARRPTYG